MRAAYRAMLPVRDYYFRGEVLGIESVIDEPTMLIGNHDGGYLAPDCVCLAMAWHERFDFQRPFYVLMHDFPFRLHEGLTRWLYRLGIRPASRHSVATICEQGDSLCVYPGGAWEAFRRYSDRREVTLNGRTGFVAESLRRRVPITPFASVGAHETLFVVGRGGWARKVRIVRAMRSDVFPLWLGLPFGVGFGPMCNIPLPSKIRVEVLPPIRLWKALGENANPDDPRVLQAGFEIVRSSIQSAVSRMYDARRWPIIG